MVYLKKDGFYITKTSKQIKIPLGHNFLSIWNLPLNKIDTDVIFQDFINIINTEDLVLLDLLTNCSIKPFIESMNNNVEKYDDIDCITISKIFEKTIEDNEVEFTEWIYVSGKLKSIEEDGCENAALNFSDWAAIKHLPIVLKNGEFIENNNGQYKTTTIDIHLTVGEFICGIFHELCFHGSPQKRDEEIKRLEKIIEGIRNGTEKLIEMKSYNFNELLNKEKEK